MRIAGGVLLIIAAVINLIAGFGYMAAGAVAGGAGKIGEMAQEEAAKQGSTMTPETKKALEEMKSAKGKGGGLAGFGVFLLVTVGTSIAGAIMLFMRKNAMFVLIAGGLAILAEIGGVVLISFGIMNVIGLAGGILAILASRSMKTGHIPGGTAQMA